MTPDTRRFMRAYFLATFPEWKRPHVSFVHDAVYNAAISLTDEEIERIVEDALIRARRDLSS